MRTATLAFAALLVAGVTSVITTPAAVIAAEAGPLGFASVNALGRDGTTGGAGGQVVTPTSASQFRDYVERAEPLVVQVDRTIALSGMQDVASNKTIVGVGTAGRITGGGLDVDGTSNVIIRNLTFTGASDDAVNITDGAHHVWIDHNDLSGAHDGALDVKRGSDYVTVSWNHFHDQRKNSLVGHSDGNGGQDRGKLRVTYHHNFFDGTAERNPRVRFADPAHVFNNYYLGITGTDSYGVATAMDAGVLVEGNHFDTVASPTKVRVFESDPGRLVQRNNVFVNSGAPEAAGTVTEPRQFYPYTVDDPNTVPAKVRAGAGVGKPVATALADGPVGFASVTALGQSGTTGGAGGPEVTVSTAADLIAAIKADGPGVVRVQGLITLAAGMYDVSSDKTVIGVGSGSGITGGGLNIGLPVGDATTPPANAVHNVIIRNLVFRAASDDSINVQMFSHHVWIDHNDLSAGKDGLIDVKRGSSYVTVSWNHTHHHTKNMLLGHDDGNAAQDTGHLRVTYHHNFFDRTPQRNPRTRFGNPVHVFNNYYVANSDTGVACQNRSGCWVEGNYFEDVEEPMTTSYSGPKGSIVERDNVYVDSGEPVVGGTVEDPRAYYSYALDPPAEVKALVTAGAGTGRI
ncbi:hypothetical protein [Umezawaea sp.]|uniref:pectate lyase family protein n=1 Tax=Umezawaea sp. TaxID=1955258 RepID=UPI002ED0E45B